MDNETRYICLSAACGMFGRDVVQLIARAFCIQTKPLFGQRFRSADALIFGDIYCHIYFD